MNDTADLFAMAGVWVVIAALIARAVPITSRWGKSLMFATLVAILFWELPLGYLHFRELCATQTKLRIIETIPAEASVCVEGFDQRQFERLIAMGFSRVEVIGQSANGRLYLEKGRFKEALLLSYGRPTSSSYCFSTRTNGVEPWHIARTDYLLLKVPNKREVARESAFFWSGLWWQRGLRPLLGNGGHCFPAESEIFRTLKKGSI
jgi:hypothetical protein